MDTPLDTDARLDKKAFYDWLDQQDGGHYELEDGKIVRVKVSKGHARIVSHFIKALGRLLDPTVWDVVAAEFALEVGVQVRFPDVVVEPAGDEKALKCEAAKLLVEVLSPSSVGRDFNLKLAEYKTLETLDAYIIASQDEPICWLWRRGTDAADARAFPDHPQEIHGRDKAIDVPALGISLPLAEIYLGVGDR